jgi:hypothetical protein
MDDQGNRHLGDGPPKRKWVVQKLPIKGGTVLRAAVLQNNHWRTPDWVQVEGDIES